MLLFFPVCRTQPARERQLRVARSLPAGLLMLWLMLLATPANAVPDTSLHPLIESLFPKATRIGPPREDAPLVPVYQLQELLGYAYESTDYSDLDGFAGRPIRMLVGLDTRGRFTGVRVLEHHEPVFLHGLGAEPLNAFISQYAGLSVQDQIIIDSRAEQASDQGPKFIDGVTKATVSVTIINDALLTSALQVARSQLEGFAQAPSARPREDLFEPLDWQTLVARGLVHRWRLSEQTVAEQLPLPLDAYPEWRTLDKDDNGEAGGGDAASEETWFGEYYLAYLNAPIIGRNLLGEEGFQRLQAQLAPGEQALMLLSTGPYPHVGPKFRPATVPKRLGLEQQGLALQLRDLNLGGEIPLSLPGAPQGTAYHLVRIKAQSGFNPASPMDFHLNLDLARNHLVRDSARFSSRYQLPESLFVIEEVAAPEAPPPVWVGIWENRLPSVFITLAALAVLTLALVRQDWLIRRPDIFYPFRWAFLGFTLFWLGFYAQGQLSVVNIYTLLLNLDEGFDLGLFLLDPVIFILWTFTFVTLLLWGRGVFCGWLCPFGALQEMLSWVAVKLGLRQWRVAQHWHRRLILLKYPLLLLVVGAAFHSLTLAGQLAELEPFKTSITLVFDRSWPFVLYALLLLGVGLFIHKFYCRYLCPLGAGLAVVGRLRRLEWLRRIDLCGNPCQVCRRNCGIHAIRRDGRIDYDECIQCLECVLILEDDNRCVARLQARKTADRAEPLHWVPGPGTSASSAAAACASLSRDTAVTDEGEADGL